jgi:hypothetical protein
MALKEKIEGVREQGAKENIWPQAEYTDRRVENSQ